MQRRSTLSGLWGGLWGGSHCVAGRGAHSSVKFLHVRGAWFGYSSMVKSPIVVLNVTSSTMVAGASAVFTKTCGSCLVTEYETSKQ